MPQPSQDEGGKPKVSPRTLYHEKDVRDLGGRGKVSDGTDSEDTNSEGISGTDPSATARRGRLRRRTTSPAPTHRAACGRAPF